MPPKFIEDYRQWAEESDRLAETAVSPRIRRTMAYVASQWRSLADDKEASAKRAKPPRTRSQHLSE
jgi:hypothetical protein